MIAFIHKYMWINCNATAQRKRNTNIIFILFSRPIIIRIICHLHRSTSGNGEKMHQFLLFRGLFGWLIALHQTNSYDCAQKNNPDPNILFLANFIRSFFSIEKYNVKKLWDAKKVSTSNKVIETCNSDAQFSFFLLICMCGFLFPQFFIVSATEMNAQCQ